MSNLITINSVWDITKTHIKHIDEGAEAMSLCGIPRHHPFYQATQNEKTGSKIDCQDCIDIWKHVKTIREEDLA